MNTARALVTPPSFIALDAGHTEALLAQGRKEAQAILAQGSKSFALAGLLLDQRSRQDAAVLYAWCRRADDRVDDAGFGQSARATRILRGELDQLFAGAATSPLDTALVELIIRRRIPRQYFEALLDGFTMDAEGWSYPTFADVDRYAYRVAGVVGLMMCHVLGVRDDRCLKSAAHLGMAMQLTNIARDVAEDFERGRQYLPHALVTTGQLHAAMLAEDPGHASRRRVALAVTALLRRAELYYQSGFSGLGGLGWRNALAIGAAGRIYRAIGRILAGRRFDALAGRAVVSLPRKLLHTAGAALSLVAELPRRWRQRKSPTRLPNLLVRFDDVKT